MRPLLFSFAVAALTSVLAACGGGGGVEPTASTPSSPASPPVESAAPPAASVSGTVAVGKPLSGASVNLDCKGGSVVATTAPDGSYSVELPAGIQTPCVITASGTASNGEAVMIHSVAPAPGTANVTPLTCLLTNTLAHQAGAPDAVHLAQDLSSNSSAQQLLSDPSVVNKAARAVSSLVSAHGGAIPNSQDFLTKPFTADHTGPDADLDGLATTGVLDANGAPSIEMKTGARAMGSQLALDGGTVPDSTATVGGSLSGLQAGTTLTLLNNSGDPLGLSANGPFRFLAQLPLGSAYAVTIGTQAPWQTCSVSGGTGRTSSPVDAIKVDCQAGSSAVVSTLATQGISNPYGVAFDPSSGNLYVADYKRDTVLKVSRDGVATSFARFDGPFSVAVDRSGNVYTVNADGTVGKVTPQGAATTFATMDENTLGDGIGVDTAGNVYVANTTSIYKIDASTARPTLIAGSDTKKGFKDGAGGAALFNYISDLAVTSDGTIYVADMGNYVIRKIAADGTVTTIAGTPGTPGYRDGVAGQSLLGGLLNSSGNSVPVTYDANGIANKTGSATYHIAVNSAGVWISDSPNNVVRLIDAKGNVSTIAGTQVFGRQTTPDWWVASNMQMKDGVGTAANFVEPLGIATNPATGELYVGDFHGNAIRKITPMPR
ncbi:hypothetical protein [Niveibacterium sp. SC-1]|uniref:hypothetical protein n=1 Tax=Niveibacterium sp. SC-1 TaxID=3135646 RepID=UPI00311D329A